MSRDERIRYVCVRPEHHRRHAARYEFTIHEDCCAFCPSYLTEGHDWKEMETTLEQLVRFGWVMPARSPLGAQRDATTNREHLPRDSEPPVAAGIPT